MRTSVRSPWQNGVAERWVGSIRREMLDYVIPLKERHLMRLSQEYIRYCHQDGTHIGLDKGTPHVRPVEWRPTEAAKVIALPRFASPVQLVSGSVTHNWTSISGAFYSWPL